MINLDRLKSNLLTSGIQKSNNALFQVIDQLIQFLKDLQTSVAGTINNTTVNQVTQIVGIIGEQGEQGEDGFPVSSSSSSSSSSNGMVPYYIAPGETFEVPIYKQALFAMNIENDGTLDISGFLIEVD